MMPPLDLLFSLLVIGGVVVGAYCIGMVVVAIIAVIGTGNREPCSVGLHWWQDNRCVDCGERDE